MNLPKLVACFALALAASAWIAPASAQTKPTDAAHTVPVIDGAIGSCTAAFTVTDENTAPIYDAKIKVHIAYGFMYARKLDLEVGTNTDGKARFEGLPARTKSGLNFQATKNDLKGTAFVDPSTTCKADLIIILQKKP